MNISLGQSFSQTFIPGTYSWKINCSDFSGNVNSSSSNSFTITTPSSGSSSSSGGGGGGTGVTSVSTPEVFEVSAAEVSSGYTKFLKKNEKINFSLFDFNGERHLLTVNKVGKDYVNLTIESEPINLVLGIGQSVKLNLSSVDYYDLLIELNSINGDEVELTIQLISEVIEKVVEVIVKGEDVEVEVFIIKDYFWVVIVLLVILSAIVFVILKKGESKKLKKEETNRKYGRKNKKVKA